MHVIACNDHVIACKVHACNGHVMQVIACNNILGVLLIGGRLYYLPRIWNAEILQYFNFQVPCTSTLDR